MTDIAAVRSDLFSWLDKVLSQPLPVRTEAFHINLYEGTDSVHVQLVGTEAFVPGVNPSSDYWPSDETFSTGEDIFEVPFDVAGVDWPQWLNNSIDLFHAYLASGRRSDVLRSSRGVGIGFVDGDMHIIWQREAA